mmetsp:Transcript_99879/g.172198  ORF Transcript_99879/g.172198 Transcript_99879/m.172198 type:complete len:91 (+) Transcript_99879:785-1057(+)
MTVRINKGCSRLPINCCISVPPPSHIQIHVERGERKRTSQVSRQVQISSQSSSVLQVEDEDVVPVVSKGGIPVKFGNLESGKTLKNTVTS